MSREEFLGEYWTKRFVHIPGSPDKFTDLFSWDVLSETLEHQRFSPTRVRLVRAGKAIETSRYLDGGVIDAGGLMKELAAGATLNFNSCEAASDRLSELCVHLERLFHVRVGANLYAGWRKDNGFEVHWDDQDTLILQVAGQKHWKIWEPTRPQAFVHDIVDTSSDTKPDGPPIWDGVLEQGGLLSMPRGWWHVAYPMDSPCLHLTVTIKNLNGIDLLTWFMHQMKASQAARLELPLLATRDAQRDWLQALWRDLSAAWSDDLLDRYLAESDARARPRPVLRLPDVGVDMGCGADTPLELALPRALRFESANGVAHFKAGGSDWQTATELVPALARFNDGLPHTIAEISPPNDQRLTLLITALMMRGVVRKAKPSRA
jgi:ribosomal protein L16 Arg81 hydroxylase